MVSGKGKDGLERAAALMRRDGLSEAVIKNFERLFHDVMLGKTGIIAEAEIDPVTDIDCFSQVSACSNALGEGKKLLGKLVVILLNGGLGTTMGL